MWSPKLCKSEKKNKTNHPESPDPRAQRSSSVPNFAIAGKKLHLGGLHISQHGTKEKMSSRRSQIRTNSRYKTLVTRIQCIAERRERSKPRPSGPQKGIRNSNVSACVNSGR
ncbi:hypothetical protein D8674_043053 [Pyrus ussuriensis x Pyrus communis]|uniref:Uncharacterized protein n=1 Tax=Pyrus ussuriensis x Pyrus communis TaxID=2448454 RepID=A0A5N5G9Z8_9ROSA|nr:hypothetical protein D8674_043053 [Pyrus ussuriensis x Pyrus communis]